MIMREPGRTVSGSRIADRLHSSSSSYETTFHSRERDVHVLSASPFRISCLNSVSLGDVSPLRIVQPALSENASEKYQLVAIVVRPILSLTRFLGFNVRHTRVCSYAPSVFMKIAGTIDNLSLDF